MKSDYDIARDKLAEWLFRKEVGLSPSYTLESYSWKERIYRAADELLALKIPHEGKTIRSGLYLEDAEMPENPYRRGWASYTSPHINRAMGYSKAQEDMAGWVKKISKEEQAKKNTTQET